MIQFHPHSGSIVSLSTDKTIDIYSLDKTGAPSLSLSNAEPSKRHFWSPISGAQILSHSTKNILSLYDPRTSPNPQMEITTSYQLNRPSHSAFLNDTTIVTTGTTPSRTRNLKLYDIRSSAQQPKLTIPFDISSSPSVSLLPLVDSTRNLTYIIQSHSSSIFAFDLNEANPLPITLQLPSTIIDAALLPQDKVDVMKVEINRLFVLTRKNEIVPVSVRIERKVCPLFFFFEGGEVNLC